jgi:hypothetical protein
LQIATQIINILKSGKISLSNKNIDLFHLTVKTNKIDFNIQDKKILKDFLSDNLKINIFRDYINQLKDIAKDLANEGYTITISYKGFKIITMGSKAKPNFSSLIIRTTDIEINNLKKLIQLAI